MGEEKTKNEIIANFEKVLSNRPRAGVYGDDEVYKSFVDLVKELSEFIPDHMIGLHLAGAAQNCRSNAKRIVYKAKILEEMIKAACIGRK